MDGMGRRVEWVLVHAIAASGKYVDGWMGRGGEARRGGVFAYGACQWAR